MDLVGGEMSQEQKVALRLMKSGTERYCSREKSPALTISFKDLVCPLCDMGVIAPIRGDTMRKLSGMGVCSYCFQRYIYDDLELVKEIDEVERKAHGRDRRTKRIGVESPE